MGKIHYIILSDSLEYSVGCVKDDLCILIGLWLNPFTFQYSPDRSVSAMFSCGEYGGR